MLCVESFAPLVTVAVQRIENDRVCLGGRPNFVDFNRFAFELFVVLEETTKRRMGFR